MGFVRMIDVLTGFLDKIRPVWVKNGAFRNINVLKGVCGRKGAFGSKMDLLWKN